MNRPIKADNQAGPNRSILAMLGGILAAAVVAGAGGCEAPPSEKTVLLPIEVERFDVELGRDDYALGPKSALVTVVMFSDFACVPCGNTWNVLRHLQEDYGGDLRIVHRSATVPGFAQGENAAEAVFAAGAQGKFWPMHQRLFDNPTDFSRPVLRAHAEALGLDVPQFVDDLDEGAYSGRRARDRRRATVLGVRALPVYFVNGLFLLGAPKGEEDIRPIIDNEIAAARKMMAKGVVRGDLYSELMKTAKRGRVGDTAGAKRLRKKRKADRIATEGTRHAPDGRKRYRVPDGEEAGAPGSGNADAPVVVVVFTDFQCPYCRKNKASIDAIRDRFTPEQLRIEVRHRPLEIHPAAMGAARASMAAHRQGKFWEFRDGLFASEALDFEIYVKLAKEVGMDLERFKRDLQDAAVADQVKKDIDLGRRLGVFGTPAAFINGKFFDGTKHPQTYAEAIEGELATAEKLVKSGTPRAELHAALMLDALETTEFPNARPVPPSSQETGAPAKNVGARPAVPASSSHTVSVPTSRSPAEPTSGG